MKIAEWTAMFKPPIGHEFQKRRATLVAKMSDCICGGRIDRLNQLTVMLRGPDAVAAHQFSNGAGRRLARGKRRIHRIEIVLANEEHGESMNRREIHALVENPCLGRRIAEENDRDGGAILQHRAEGRTDTDWDGAPDNRDAAEEVDRQVDEVHRSPLARRAPLHLALQFREHGPQPADLADVMPMRSVLAILAVILTQNLST